MTQMYSIGHSNRSLEQLLDLLHEFEIDLLADVRHYPGSKHCPHFNRDQLQSTVPAHEIGYMHFEALGGRRHGNQEDSPNGGLRHASFRNYADYMTTDAFTHAVEQLLDQAAARRTAMMCAEAVYWRCHRRLISDYLYATRGLVVHHILGPHQCRDHHLTDTAHPTKAGVTYPPPLKADQGL